MVAVPDDWDTVKALFGAALELESEERPAFLLRMSIDPNIRAQVEKLLSEHDQAAKEHFLSSPVLGAFGSKAESQNQRFQQGQLLAGRFKLIRFIAAGGMGEVYEAEDLELRERVAIKTILPDILLRANAVSRFKREVQLARKVTHPNVCRIFDLFRHRPEGASPDQEILIVSMELLHGNTLAERLRQVRPIQIDEALGLIRQLASALAAAHQLDIIHRDFKPGNVILVTSATSPDTSRAVVTDFGLAFRSIAPTDTTLSRSATLMTERGLLGTPSYMAPEQLDGRLATPACDVHALGVVAYEIVTGMHPYPETNLVLLINAILNQHPDPPSNLNSRLSSPFDALILKALDKDPRKRYQSADEFLNVLERIDPLSPSAGTPATSGYQARGEADSSAVNSLHEVLPKQARIATATEPTRRSPGRAWFIPAGLAAVLLGIGIGFRYWKPTESNQSHQTETAQQRRTLSYYIVSQMYRHGQPYGDPAWRDEDGAFAAGSHFRVVFSSAQSGYLYVLNEGPASSMEHPLFVILFPSPSTNGGSAKLTPGIEHSIPEGGTFLLDEHKGTERLWLIWSKESLPEFEDLKKWANIQDHGKVGDIAQLRRLESFLANSTSTNVERDNHSQKTTLSVTGDVLVYNMELNHS